MLRVAIVGPGALGRALGGVLERGGAEVGYIGRDGPIGKLPAALDLGLILVKAYDTEAALRGAAATLARAGGVLTLQNGMGNVEKIVAAGIAPDQVLGGSTTHAARRDAQGRVEHVAEGKTWVAPFRADGTGLAMEIAAALTQHGLKTAPMPSLAPLLWRKLAVSCGVNALTALERCPNGALLERPEALARAVAAAREALALGHVPDADAEDLIRDVCTRTAANRSSMLQDLEAGRRTEVDSINGYVAARGGPVNQELTRLIHEREKALTHA